MSRSSVRTVQVFTHRRAAGTTAALEVLLREAAEAGVLLRFDEEETERHGLSPDDGIVVDTIDHEGVDLAIVLGGDGTILGALRRFCRTGVPVFAANFGQVGFLATVEGDSCELGFRRAFAGEYDVLELPAISVTTPGGDTSAINDVSINRKVGERVAVLGYQLEGEEVGSVRCDGVVVATPAGSTGYNLANGGPVLAWGVGGYVVSFIAPHSLTARPIVAAPSDLLTVVNRSEEWVDVSVDGRPAGELGPGQHVECRFELGAGLLAQLPGSTFYGRLREKFGHLV